MRPVVLDVRRHLADGRQKLQASHGEGAPGIQVSAKLGELADEAVRRLYDGAAENLADPSLLDRVVVLVHGSLGRGDAAPYSDVDLAIVHLLPDDAELEPFVARLVGDVCDAGLKLGHAVFNLDEVLDLGVAQPELATSLIDARAVAGSQGVARQFSNLFLKRLQSRGPSVAARIVKARAQERRKYGETVYLLEPNVKRSPGALRDLDLIRWLGFVLHGRRDPEELQLAGLLTRDEHRRLRDARDFLLRMRHELHFKAGRLTDVLDRYEQQRIAEAWKYEHVAGVMPVERFMQDYFQHTHFAARLARRFEDSVQRTNWSAQMGAFLLSHQVERDFLVGPKSIKATRRGARKLRLGLHEVLRLADLSNLYNVPIDRTTWDEIRRFAPSMQRDHVDRLSAARFLSLLQQPARLYDLLCDFHEVGLLEILIPDFARTRCLLQFNQYHKYTVDEHSLRAVRAATDFADRDDAIGDAYRSLRDRRLLHLAVLLHDLGKGLPEDHCETGQRIADEVATRLGLPLHERETVKFLVHRHLLMSHLAFWRDTSDAKLIVDFAVEVGSPERLRLLFLLTAADLAAVAPGWLSDWRASVLSDLYRRTMQRLASDSAESEAALAPVQQADVMRLLKNDGDWETHRRQLESLPRNVLLTNSAEEIADLLRRLQRLRPGDVAAWWKYRPEVETTEYSVAAWADAPGVFHRLVGALNGAGIRILAAEIKSLEGGLFFDRFETIDLDHKGETPGDRAEGVCRRLEQSVRDAGLRPKFRKLFGAAGQPIGAGFAEQPTRIRTDVATSDRYTIIDVFTQDRTGLLYTITRTLFELDLSIRAARIGTHLDQVVDVFYVTDSQQRKVTDRERLSAIEERLQREIDEYRPPV